MRYIHGMWKTRFYCIWKNIVGRSNGNNKFYKKTPTNEWGSFVDFKKDMYKLYLVHVKKHGEKNTSIDRIDNTKGYSKNNCRWATRGVQSLNRSSNVVIKYNGKSKTIKEWSVILDINYSTLRDRIKKYKFPIKLALCKKKIFKPSSANGSSINIRKLVPLNLK